VLWLTDWQKDFGGYTSYIAEGEDEEVSCLLPLAVLIPLMGVLLFRHLFVRQLANTITPKNYGGYS